MKTLDEALREHCERSNHPPFTDNPCAWCKELKAALKALVLACVPEEVTDKDVISRHGVAGWNGCRAETLKRLEEIFK